ncbi:SMYD3 [Symbiodinium sp. CCMP2456]|nr:SMYD3 [Symbiodinium sp. CCMP2456]
MADRSFRGLALVLLLLRLFCGVPPCLLLHGNGRAVFRGSVGRLSGPAWAKLREEPCQVLDFRGQEQMWSLRLRDGRTVLAEGSKEQGFFVDHCVLPEALLFGNRATPKEVRVTETVLAGKALEARVDISRNREVFQELPFLVADRSDLARSRLAAFEDLQAHSEGERLQSAFEELTTGGLEGKCMEEAARLADSETSVEKIARVLARWQCNSQRMSVPPASGLYRLHSFLQHSCAPNCAVGVLFSTGEVLVRAIRDICKGELLTRNYEREAFLELPASERQQHLLQTRGFTCLCERCARESGEQKLEYGGKLTADSDKSAQLSSGCGTCRVQSIYGTGIGERESKRDYAQ